LTVLMAIMLWIVKYIWVNTAPARILRGPRR